MMPHWLRGRLWLLLAVVLPLLGVLTGVARSELHYRRSQEWQFAVAGYDPRDLLKGHYIAYRLNFREIPGSSRCPDDDASCCLCLTRTNRDEPDVSRLRCDEANTCDGRLRADTLSTLDRYYVPEARAHEAEQRLRDGAARQTARLVVAIDPAGKPQVKNLLVDGQPLLP
jgi:uncharacterized membrane-anchored protein